MRKNFIFYFKISERVTIWSISGISDIGCNESVGTSITDTGVVDFWRCVRFRRLAPSLRTLNSESNDESL